MNRFSCSDKIRYGHRHVVGVDQTKAACYSSFTCTAAALRRHQSVVTAAVWQWSNSARIIGRCSGESETAVTLTAWQRCSHYVWTRQTLMQLVLLRICVYVSTTAVTAGSCAPCCATSSSLQRTVTLCVRSQRVGSTSAWLVGRAAKSTLWSDTNFSLRDDCASSRC